MPAIDGGIKQIYFEEGRSMMAAKATRALKLFSCLLWILILAVSFSAALQVNAAVDSMNILPERERARIMDEWLKWRLDNILPELMRR
jgi:hypothetical protein